jgi:hypothetical protein
MFVPARRSIRPSNFSSSEVTVDVLMVGSTRVSSVVPNGEVPIAYEASTSTPTDYPPSPRFTRVNSSFPELAASS